MAKDPANRTGEWLGKTFVLSYDYPAHEYPEQCKELWCGVIEQAVGEYVYYKFSRDPNERSMYYNARDFLFDDNYKIYFGSRDISLRELMDLLGIDIDYFRSGVLARAKLAQSNLGYETGTQLPLF